MLAQPRPLMALCAELTEKYQLLVTYEDAPFDPASELDGQIIPRNGFWALTPKWKPITFHIPSTVSKLPEGAPPQPQAVGVQPSVTSPQFRTS
ncbi:MAG: hypothetical protein JO051_10640 [Acidobacteriaceae bacterium]|nr:hypothetical protein [Acidobacteriaceae bacterium]